MEFGMTAGGMKVSPISSAQQLRGHFCIDPEGFKAKAFVMRYGANSWQSNAAFSAMNEYEACCCNNFQGFQQSPVLFEDLKYVMFVSGHMGCKLITDVPGIGDAYGQNMRSKGIFYA